MEGETSSLTLWETEVRLKQQQYASSPPLTSDRKTRTTQNRTPDFEPDLPNPRLSFYLVLGECLSHFINVSHQVRRTYECKPRRTRARLFPAGSWHWQIVMGPGRVVNIRTCPTRHSRYLCQRGALVGVPGNVRTSHGLVRSQVETQP